MNILIKATAIGAIGFTLIACDSPSPKFLSANASVQKIDVEGSTFSVHRLGNEVEVHRTSTEALPNRSTVLRRSKIAIERTTGCQVAKDVLIGDQAIQRAQLDCS